VLHRFLDFKDSGSHAAALEAGCGTGHWLRRMAAGCAAGLRIVGIDTSAEMLQQARLPGGSVELAQATAEALPLADASFDRVYCVNALHHFAGKAIFIADARRVLRSGGGFMTIGLDPHAQLDRWWIYDYFDGALESDLRRYPS